MRHSEQRDRDERGRFRPIKESPATVPATPEAEASKAAAIFKMVPAPNRPDDDYWEKHGRARTEVLELMAERIKILDAIIAAHKTVEKAYSDILKLFRNKPNQAGYGRDSKSREL